MFSGLKEFSKEKRIIVKILAVLLVIVLTFTNFALLGKYLGEGLIAYAADSSLGKQDNNTNIENVKFEVYLADNNKSKKTIEKDINATDVILYVQVTVQGGGVLKEGTISFGNTNFKVDKKDKEKLNLDTILSGQDVTIEIPVNAQKGNGKFNLGLLDMISEIKLAGKYTNNDGNVVSVDSEKNVKITWNSSEISEQNNPIILTQEIITNDIFEINGENKRVVQVLVNSGLEGNVYPILETNVEVKVPTVTIPGEMVTQEVIYPETVRVSTINGAVATNGKTELAKLGEVNVQVVRPNTWSYNAREGMINIKSTNLSDSNNNVSWMKSGLDEYIITYVYPENVEIGKIKSDISSEILLHGSDNTKLTRTNSITEENLDEMSNITRIEVNMTESAYKSNLYIGQPIEYVTDLSVGISYADVLDEIIVAEGSDTMRNEDGSRSYSQSICKSLYLSQENFLSIFGNEGSIAIYNFEDNRLIAEITAESIADENGNIEIQYPENIRQIYIKTSNPVAEGKLNIHVNKMIVPDGLSFSDISNIARLETIAVLSGSNDGDVVEERQSSQTMKLEDPVTISGLGMSKTILSAAQVNDVVFTITLKTDDLKYNLYKNPVFKIEIPSYIKEVNVSSIELINGNGLEIVGFEGVKTNSNGSKTIEIELTGDQNTYGTDTKISINAALEVEQFIPDIETGIYLSFENGKDIKQVVGVNNTDKIDVYIQSVPGMLLANSVSLSGEEFVAFKNDIEIGTLEMGIAAVEATFKGMIINNTKNSPEDVKILGRIPSVGNTDLKNGQDLGSTVDAILKSTISVKSNVREDVVCSVYYSDLETATNDLEDPENGWTSNGSGDSKSYLIVMESLADKEIVEFEYVAEIPANLTKNQELYTIYAVYYEDTATEAPLLGLQTQKEISLEVTLSSSENENSVIFKGQNLIYTILVENTGEVNARNINITNILPQGVRLVEEDQKTEWTVESLKPGESIEEKIEVVVLETNNEEKITNVVKVEADYLSEAILKSIEHKIGETNLSVNVSNRIEKYMEPLDKVEIGAKVYYDINVTNRSEDDIADVVVTSNLPAQIGSCLFFAYNVTTGEYIYIDDPDISYNENTRELVWNIEELKAGETLNLSIEVFVREYAPEIVHLVTITCENELGKGNSMNLEVNLPMKSLVMLNSEISSPTEGQTVRAGDTVKYNVSIVNSGETVAVMEVTDNLPEQLAVVSLKYTIGDRVIEIPSANKGISLVFVNLGENQTMEIELVAKVKEHATAGTIENFVTVSGEGFDELVTSKVMHLVAAKEETNPDPDPSRTYTITGVAWLDANRNGARDTSEKLLEGMTVKLKNITTNEYVANASKKTDKDGMYTLSNIPVGSYMVVFEIDNNTYDVTEYMKEKVLEPLSSKAITTITSGALTTHTDRIEVTNKDITNINIGLVTKPVFDLEVNKYVSKTTVQNQDGTEILTYSPESGKLAKVDVRARYLDKTLVVVEYTIAVTNKGDVTGYARTIVDHLSPELVFNSELNTSWYEGADSTLYSKALANTEIKPGETKAVTLVLTKTMTSNNVGLTNNIAEISEYYNEYAVQDLAKANDESEADVIVTIRTGSPAMYMSIIVVCMAMLRAEVYILSTKKF